MDNRWAQQRRMPFRWGKPRMMIERNMKRISPTGAVRNVVPLIVQLLVGVFTLFLLIYF